MRFIRAVFFVEGLIKGAMFSIGLNLIRGCHYGVSFSSDKSLGINGCHIRKPVRPVISKSHPGLSMREERKADLRRMMWLLAEPPHDHGYDGTINSCQHALLVEICKGVWCGGAEGEFLLLINEILIEDKLHISGR